MARIPHRQRNALARRKPPSLDTLEASYSARLRLGLAPLWQHVEEHVLPLADLPEEPDGDEHTEG